MDINVRGTATARFTPELVVVTLTFTAKESKYEKVVERGTEAVNAFVSQVLSELADSKDSMKTHSYRIQETYQYQPGKKSSFDGYSFTQSARIEFNYDVKKMALFVELVSKLKNPPAYLISFEVKDEDAYKNQVLSEAAKKAKATAKAIADAVGISLVKCVKADYKPFDEFLTSNSRIRSGDFGGIGNTGQLPVMIDSKAAMSVSENIQNTFTPEDIIISETIYCLWLAE